MTDTIYHNSQPATGDRFEVRQFDPESGKLLQTIPVVGKFHQNDVISFTQSARRGIGFAYRTMLRPVVLANKLWLLVTTHPIPDHPTIQQINDADEKAANYLYQLKEGKFQQAFKIEQADGMRFLNAHSKSNILAFSSDEPDFHITFFKFHG